MSVIKQLTLSVSDTGAGKTTDRFDRTKEIRNAFQTLAVIGNAEPLEEGTASKDSLVIRQNWNYDDIYEKGIMQFFDWLDTSVTFDRTTMSVSVFIST
jgi:hypothetical protein